MTGALIELLAFRRTRQDVFLDTDALDEPLRTYEHVNTNRSGFNQRQAQRVQDALKDQWTPSFWAWLALSGGAAAAGLAAAAGVIAAMT